MWWVAGQALRTFCERIELGRASWSKIDCSGPCCCGFGREAILHRGPIHGEFEPVHLLLHGGVKLSFSRVMSAPVEGREFAGLAGWGGGTKRLAGRVLHHCHETSACQFAGHTTDRGLAALEVLDTQIKPVLSNRFVQVQIDGLKQTAHGIPEIWTGQGNGNAPVDLLTMGGGELFLHL